MNEKHRARMQSLPPKLLLVLIFQMPSCDLMRPDIGSVTLCTVGPEETPVLGAHHTCWV